MLPAVALGVAHTSPFTLRITHRDDQVPIIISENNHIQAILESQPYYTPKHTQLIEIHYSTS